MRKGADCLSKWVGESERQLRLLFDQVCKVEADFYINLLNKIIIQSEKYGCLSTL